jgi:hypothetical protein
MVEQELKNVESNDKKMHDVFNLMEALEKLYDETALYNCLEEHPYSIDRTYDKDRDFVDKKIRRPHKIRRRFSQAHARRPHVS